MHTQLNDAEFEERFSNCSIDPAIFDHEAHLRLAYVHLRKYGRKAACENIVTQLKRFVTHVSATDKYNETLTIAAIFVVDHFMRKEITNSFQEFIDLYPRLRTNFKDLIAQHYSIDIFSSAAAKQSFIQADLLPFC